jgi:esterase/lipase
MTTNEKGFLELSSQSVMQDEVLAIAMAGLDPWARVTLRLATEIDGTEFVSSADYYADESGRIKLATQAPVTGSYQGTDAMGLFWSMTPETFDKGPMAGATRDPWDVQGSQTYELTALLDNEVITSTSLERVIVPEGVTVRRLKEGRLRGVLFLPAGDGPHPALLGVTGSGGGYYSSEGAAALASRGFAVLGMAYFNAPDLPEQLVNIPLEYFEESLEWLAAVPEVDSDRIGIIGGSRGGELALILGSRFPRIKAVVSKVPSHVVWPGCCTEEAFEKPSWTWRGEPLVAMAIPEIADRARQYWPDGLENWLGFYWIILGDTESEAAALIPVEKINGPVLLITGGDDQCWPATYMADLVMERLEARNFPHPHIHLRYDDSGHAAGSLPYWPSSRMVNPIHPLNQEPIALGGTAESLANSSKDSYQRTLEFLEKYL